MRSGHAEVNCLHIWRECHVKQQGPRMPHDWLFPQSSILASSIRYSQTRKTAVLALIVALTVRPRARKLRRRQSEVGRLVRPAIRVRWIRTASGHFWPQFGKWVHEFLTMGVNSDAYVGRCYNCRCFRYDSLRLLLNACE